MKCADAERRLYAQLEREAPCDPEALEHARTCPACSEQLRSIRRLSSAIAAWRNAVPAVDISAAVLTSQAPFGAAEGAAGHRPDSVRPLRSSSAAPGTAARPDRLGRRRSRGALVVACSALATLVAVSWLAPPESLTSRSRSVVQSTPPVHGPVQPTPGTSPMSERYDGLGQQALGVLDELVALVMPGRPMETPPQAPQSDSSSLLDDLQNQLRPIRKSLDEAFDFLWAVGESPEKSST